MSDLITELNQAVQAHQAAQAELQPARNDAAVAYMLTEIKQRAESGHMYWELSCADLGQADDKVVASRLRAKGLKVEHDELFMTVSWYPPEPVKPRVPFLVRVSRWFKK